MISRLERDAFAKAREHYERTNDIRYVAIAIGKADPNDIPRWALAACQDFAERVVDATPRELSHFGVSANAVASTLNDNDYRLVLARMQELQSLAATEKRRRKPSEGNEGKQNDFEPWRVSLYAACKDLRLSDSSTRTMRRYYESELQTHSDWTPEELNISAIDELEPNSKLAKHLRTIDKASRHPRRIQQRIMRVRKRQLARE